MVEHGIYTVGTPEEVEKELKEAWQKSGGFGTLLLITGMSWSTREKRARSMRAFMDHVAPKLRGLPASV